MGDMSMLSMSEQCKTMMELLLEAMNVIGDGVVIVDQESQIIYINKAYTTILRVPKEKVLHKQVKVIEPGAMILDTLNDHKCRYNQIVEVKTRGKKIMVNITPIIRHDALIGAVSVFRDITELSLSQQEFERAQRWSHTIFKAAASEDRHIPAVLSYIIGENPHFLRCLRLISLVAPTDATVLIEGESGAGKEVMVNAILSLSDKRRSPYVNINCAAIPETLMESELFGYTAGSFTGASKGGKIGKFELADGGTLFLDEIGEMPLFMQAKLLRALQSGEIQKIGSNTVQKVDVRVIAATNRNLKQMVREGKFREDLYFRLNTFTIHIPPLRERGQDIALLANYFLKRFARKYSKKQTLSNDAMAALMTYSWPGNVRELESCIEYAVIVCNDGVILRRHLPEEIQISQATEHKTPSVEQKVQEITREAKAEPEKMEVKPAKPLWEELEEVERNQIIQALKRTNGNKTKAMEILGISRRTFYKRLKKYHIE